MSLEQAILENTAAIKQLIAALGGATNIALATKAEEIRFEPIDEPVVAPAEEVQNDQPRDELIDAEKTEEVAEAKVVAQYSQKDVTAALMSVAKYDREELISILKEVGVSKVPEISEDQYPRVMQLAEQVLESANA